MLTVESHGTCAAPSRSIAHGSVIVAVREVVGVGEAVSLFPDAVHGFGGDAGGLKQSAGGGQDCLAVRPGGLGFRMLPVLLVDVAVALHRDGAGDGEAGVAGADEHRLLVGSPRRYQPRSCHCRPSVTNGATRAPLVGWPRRGKVHHAEVERASLFAVDAKVIVPAKAGLLPVDW